jgi:hypothetical protein
VKSKTYDEWQELGYQVIKGEKSEGKNAQGKPTFTRDQVKEKDDIGNFRMQRSYMEDL